ncbi:ABC transporter ATP-binding protein [Chlamydiota bacterium]
MPVVEFKNVSKVFRKFLGFKKVEAVKNVSFCLEKGQIFGLLGPNGSGKTTTLKLLLGMLRPTTGKIVIMGNTPNALSVKRNIGFLPEASYLYPFLTGKESLEYYGKLAGLSQKLLRMKIPNILDMVGLTSDATRFVREYSKGMGRRLQLAQVLLKDPEIFFLDEPTIGLDPIGSKEMKDIITELKTRGKTLLLSSHLLSEVENLCDRIGILYKGSLIKEGNLSELLEISTEYKIITDEVNEEDKAAIRSFLQKKNITILSEGHPKRGLDEIFITEVEKNKK